jgi:hypothetical protein
MSRKSLSFQLELPRIHHDRWIFLPRKNPSDLEKPMLQQKGRVNWFALLLIIFAAAMAYWLWQAHAQVSLEIELACRLPSAEACAAAKARYTNSFLSAWFSQMFPWIFPFLPAFIYVFFFRWLRKNKQID